MKTIIAENYNEVSKIAANMIKEVIESKDKPVLGLATGSTPEGLYSELIKMNKDKLVDFSNVYTVNLDEYVGLKPENDQSYRYFMNDRLFNHVNINKENTFVPNGVAEDIEEESKAYDRRIEELGGIDVQILGIGLNGHIGFNEPGDYLISGTHRADLAESTIKVNARFFDKIEEVPTQAMTMGIGTIMKARKIILIVRGENKANAVKELLEGKITTKNPSTILNLHNDVTVIMEKEISDKM